MRREEQGSASRASRDHARREDDGLVLHPQGYSVTVMNQPVGQTCAVTSGAGTMGSENLTNVTVTCADDPE